MVIVGAGAAEVKVNVPFTSIASVHVGRQANVTSRGATRSVPGSVTSISLLLSAVATGAATGQEAAQSTATASTPTYPVVVLVRDALPALGTGSHAEARLLIGAASGVRTIPNSALTPLVNRQALALTFKGGVATRTLVKTGYVGTLTTQITSDLSSGGAGGSGRPQHRPTDQHHQGATIRRWRRGRRRIRGRRRRWARRRHVHRPVRLHRGRLGAVRDKGTALWDTAPAHLSPPPARMGSRAGTSVGPVAPRPRSSGDRATAS